MHLCYVKTCNDNKDMQFLLKFTYWLIFYICRLTGVKTHTSTTLHTTLLVCLIISLSLSFVLFFSIIMLLGASPGPCHYGLLILYSLFSPTGVNTNQGLLNLHSPVYPVNIWSHPRQEDLPPFVKVPKSLKNTPPRPQWWHVLSAGSNQFNYS